MPEEHQKGFSSVDKAESALEYYVNHESANKDWWLNREFQIVQIHEVARKITFKEKKEFTKTYG